MAREIVLRLSRSVDVDQAIASGIRTLLCEEDQVQGLRTKGVSLIAPSPEADILLIDDSAGIGEAKKVGKPFAYRLRVTESSDISRAVEVSRLGAKIILVETPDWKIIPLENLVAELHKGEAKLYARVGSVAELPTMFGILERGVDGVVIDASNMDEIKRAISILTVPSHLELAPARVLEVRDLGSGDRACVDTVSLLELGEGMLIGSMAGFLFLIHNEAVGSKFTSPRPFRVNCGTVQSYILLPNGKTKYLSELQAGDEVMIVSSEGRTKPSIVGRVKIERRPLRLVRAETGDSRGSILVQNAETIRFIGKNRELISVTELKGGEEVLVSLSPGARHFGIPVEEFVLEK